MLAGLRRLRGTAFDVFGRTGERRRERALIGEYETLVDELLASLAPHNHVLAVELARIPEEIRGYGHVKVRHLDAAKREGGRPARALSCRDARRSDADADHRRRVGLARRGGARPVDLRIQKPRPE